MSGVAKDLSGQQFGRLTVIERIENKGACVQWLCRCDCGNLHKTISASLRAGTCQSCGCLGEEHRLKSITKHGATNTRLYSIWRNMKCRCSCPTASKYELYGGKGITVCNEWLTFGGFRSWALENGYAANLSIDRINGNKSYYPSNCQWVSYKKQANNTTQNHYLIFGGERKTIAEWADKLGFNYKVLSERIRRGWSTERALTTPTQK